MPRFWWHFKFHFSNSKQKFEYIWNDVCKRTYQLTVLWGMQWIDDMKICCDTMNGGQYMLWDPSCFSTKAINSPFQRLWSMPPPTKTKPRIVVSISSPKSMSLSAIYKFSIQIKQLARNASWLWDDSFVQLALSISITHQLLKDMNITRSRNAHHLLIQWSA